MSDHNADGSRLKVTELEWHALEWMLFNLDEADRRELFGISPTDNVLEIAAGIMRTTTNSKGLGWLAWVNGRPAAAFGVYEHHRGLLGDLVARHE